MNRTHGYYGTPVYAAWQSMKSRCNKASDISFPRYGGRGISVCQHWGKFQPFLDDMGEPPPGHQLDRIDNDGNYTPENCRWVTAKQNTRNRRSTKLVSVDGGPLIALSEAIEQHAVVTRGTVYRRVNKGWSVEDALRTPVQSYADRVATRQQTRETRGGEW